MTWKAGADKEYVEVSCGAPGCTTTETLRKGERSAAVLQKLLFDRGWGFTFAAGGGRDLCPAHNREGSP